MDIIYLLLPVALVIVLIIIGIFFWAVRSDQFDDLEGPAYRILMDDDSEETDAGKKPAKTPKTIVEEKNDSGL
jgi:cbb3-type cytochrome oxidase maturation protein